jgi:hypothetical protein
MVVSVSRAFDGGAARKPKTLRLEKWTMTSNPLVGTWRLISWENRSADGQISYPLGEHAVGYIMYNQDGYMSVAIMRPDRAKFAAGDLFGGSTEEKARAADTYVSYCGPYEFRGDTVVHHVELSLFPNWVGGAQERLVELTGDRLVLSSTRAMLLGGAQRTAHLIWERV